MRKKITFLIHLFVGISFCSVNVLCNDKVNVGIVTPGNYKDEGGCIFDNRTTVQMGEEFANLSCNLYGDTNLLFHYKNANAWEIDLKSGQNNTNLNVDDVDLAIIIHIIVCIFIQIIVIKYFTRKKMNQEQI